MNLTRRNFTKLASQALWIGAFPALARAELTPLDVRMFGAKGNGRDDDTMSFAKALMNNNAVILVPENYQFRIDGDVVLENCKLIVVGKILGKGSLRFKGTVEIRGPGSISLNSTLGSFKFLDGGRFLVEGIQFEDCNSLAAIMISPGEGHEIESLTIRDCQFRRVNYGILRQASNSLGSVSLLTVSKNQFRSIRGDAIEINCATQDSKVIIEDNFISSVDNPDKKPFWGIGIGLSGRKYTENGDPAVSIKNFVVRNNHLENLRQGIHVESGRDFSIENNTIENISPSFSVGSGLDVRGIVTYGCSNFQIRGNTVRRVGAGFAISNEYGVIDSRYVGAPRNLEITDNNLSEGGALNSNSGSSDGYIVIKGNQAGSIRHRGRIGRFSVEDNQISGSVKPFDIDFGLQAWLARLLGRQTIQVHSCGNLVAGVPYEVEYRGSSRNVERCGASR
jgi:polygalacturonase